MERVWKLMRQDDNGAVYTIAWNLTENEATELKLELESYSHKQLYWLERIK